MYGKRTIKPLILSALILSGFASLVYQVIWQRVLTQVIGIDAVAISIIVAAFMAGLGVGGGLAGKIIHIVRRPLLWLALLEILIGTFGVISVGLIRAINQMGGFSSIWAQVALNIVLLEPAIIMMGTTSPLMVEAWARHVKEKEAVGTAYGANILGAAVGILIGGFLLIGIFGLQKSTYIVALLDIAAGAAFFFADWRMAAKAPQRSESLGYKNQATVVPPTGLLPALSAFLIGFSAIGYEIIFFRLLQTYYGVTPYVFPTVLFAYLINMSLGVYFIPKIKAASRRFHIFSISACAIVLSVPVIFFQKFLLSIDYGQLLFVFDPTLTSPDAMLIQIVRALLLSASLMLPVVFISGLFPLIVEHDMNSRDQSAGVSFGHIYLFQTLGNTLGALVTGLILFDHMGVVGALMLMGVLLLAASCLIIGTTEHLSFRAIDPISLSIGLIVVFLFGSYDYFQSVKYYMTKDLQISPKHV